MAEARDFGHSYVGTEHLLLGLLREEKGSLPTRRCFARGCPPRDR